jgi:hypothetical protein
MERVDELLAIERTSELPFTHGQRIFDWGRERGNHINQIDDYVVPMLRQNNRSRRAIVTYSDPSVDQTPENRAQSIVAPQLAQFDLREGAVHVTAYYRAHDIYRFWPVNFIELVRLQARVCQQLDAKVGTITTISHNAYINSAAFSDAPTAFVLPIEASELYRLAEDSFRTLLAEACNGQQAALKELGRLVRSDLDKVNYRILKTDRFQTMCDVISATPGLEDASHDAVRLVSAIRGLIDGAAKEASAARASDFLAARSIADTMLYRMGDRPLVRPIVLAVEGFSLLPSAAGWLDDLDQVLKEDFPEAIYIKRRFRISLTHILRWRTNDLFKDFLHYYTTSIQTHESPFPPVLVVAYSYGSLIVATSALRFPDLRFDKLLFASSVVKSDWDWGRIDFQLLMNEVGGADWVARVAGYVGWLGDAGLRGFRPGRPPRGKITNVTNRSGRHGDTLSRLHMQRVWIPFLRYGRTLPPPQLQLDVREAQREVD